MKNKIIFFIFLSIVFISLYLGVRLGVAENLSWDQMLALRLPRVILAFGVGAGLSIAGLVMQSLFSNPLSEPYTLGVSSGAALGAVIGMTLFPGFEFDGISPLAFFGALIFGLVLFFISKRFALRSVVILLMGVMFSFLGSSLMALWMTIADPMGVQAVLGWMLGDLSRARLTSALFVLFTVFVITFFMFFKSRSFDALLLGEFEAKTLGVDVGSLRSLMIILTSVLVGVCVSASGLIGFVGLIVPHLLRRLVGVSHQRLLPLGFLSGGMLLVLSDLLARISIPPHEIPVGVVTAVLGAPLFIFIFLNEKKTL